MTESASIEAKRAEARSRFSILTETSLSGDTTDPAVAELRDDILTDLLAPEACVSRFYERTAPGFLSAYLAVSRLPELQRIAVNAVDADRQAHTDDGVGWPQVIFTARPGERYALSDPAVFDMALQIAEHDIACDLAASRDAYCISSMQFLKRHKISAVDTNGAWINRPFTFPMHYQDYAVMARICGNCWIAFLKKYKIKPASIQNPWETVN